MTADHDDNPPTTELSEEAEFRQFVRQLVDDEIAARVARGDLVPAGEAPDGEPLYRVRTPAATECLVEIWDMTDAEIRREADRRDRQGEAQHARELREFLRWRQAGVITRTMSRDEWARAIRAARQDDEERGRR